jgi:hypothetical protein
MKRAQVFLLGLPVPLRVAGSHRHLRWLAAPLAVVCLGCATLDALDRPISADASLTSEQLQQVYAALLTRVAPGGPNHLHSRRLFHYAPPFAAAEGANLSLVQAAALLHDSAKENGAGEPKERFCTHGEQAADFTAKVMAGLGKSEAFSARASAAVREHMGPCGFNKAFSSERFMSKFCARSYPPPRSPEARVLYDLDMLDLMTVDGVVKVAQLRQTNPEFGKEPLKDSVLTGPDPAWKSVVDAQQTLLTPRANECGLALARHTQRFVDGLDFERVQDLAGLKAAAASYLSAHPLPACLPPVPPLDGSPSP